MNFSAEIAAFVLARGNPTLEDIGDTVGTDEATTKNLVGKLGAQGILKRVGDNVRVDDKARAQTLAQQSSGDYSNNRTPSFGATPAPRLATPEPQKPGPKPRIPLATDVEILTGIPLPPPRLGRTSPPCPWPLGQMEIGQMFEVAVPDGYTATDVANQVRKDIKTYDRLNPGRFFAVRVFEDARAKPVVGCWREAQAPVRGAHLKKPKAVTDVPQLAAVIAGQKNVEIPVVGKARIVHPAAGADKGRVKAASK